MSIDQRVKDIAYTLDRECWISYSGMSKAFKSAIEIRRNASLAQAQRQFDQAAQPPPDTTDTIARAICAESCAYRGEPACYEMRDDQGNHYPWPHTGCDEPGCQALAERVVAALEAMQ